MAQDITVTGDFASKLLFRFERFGNRIDFALDRIYKREIESINEYILKFLKLEGYDVIFKLKKGDYIFTITMDRLNAHDDFVADDFKFQIHISYNSFLDAFNNNYNSCLSSVNINYADVSTRVNTVTENSVMALIFRAVLKSRSLSVVQLYDLYRLQNRKHFVRRDLLPNLRNETIFSKLICIAQRTGKAKREDNFRYSLYDYNEKVVAEILDFRKWMKNLSV